MTLVVEQILSCDLCRREIRRFRQQVRPGMANQIINGPDGRLVGAGTQDVCADCYGPLMEAFRHIKLQNEIKAPE
jgi:hypothetical protein